MKYKGLNECWTCTKPKEGKCKRVVTEEHKRLHAGCSEWENKELYDAWYAEFGKEYEEMGKAVEEYYKKREQELAKERNEND